MTKDHYYIVMEYINGGSLTDCLKKYQQSHKKSFPEEIVQYLMRQIVDAIKYLHSQKIIHRDLKLDNIMVSFDSENDKNMLNMMRGRIKIIDFGFAIHLAKSNLAFSALGSPINMDPKILRKFTKRGEDINNLGYDYKADIWSLGTICYELLIGQAVFNAETMNDLVKKVENGSYSVPTSLSKEVVSFLNGMLQYNPNYRFSADDLSKQPFLTKRINEFSKIDTRRVSKKVSNKGLQMNVKQNQTIWAIFNEEDEKKLLNIKGGRDLPAPQGPMPLNNQQTNNLNNINNNNFGAGIYRSHTYQNPSFSRLNQGNSFYGQNMYPSMRNPGMNGMYQQNQIMPNMQMQPMPGMPLMSGMQPIPGQQIPAIQPMPGIYSPMVNYPTFNIAQPPPPYAPNAGIYPSNNSRYPQPIPTGYTPYANEDDDDVVVGFGGRGDCNIQ